MQFRGRLTASRVRSRWSKACLLKKRYDIKTLPPDHQQSQVCFVRPAHLVSAFDSVNVPSGGLQACSNTRFETSETDSSDSHIPRTAAFAATRLSRGTTA